MMTGSTLLPEILWAQRTNDVYLTINVQDIKKETLTLTKNALSFSGESHGKEYALEVELYAEIDVEQSKKHISPREIVIVLAKKEEDKPYWPRLSAKAGKYHHIKTDFARWKDEDEDDEEPAPGAGAGAGASPFGDMDFSQFGAGGMGGLMGGMPGMGGMGGMGGLGGMDVR
ncbi:hypothetical protein HK096_011207 [Nowakowskiella sp. JEL0078]|nr:hypothetical protein HK096_011207 [Nowakowskiella sp. JEL0078]